MTKPNDLTGKVFSRLTVLSRDGSNTEGRALWRCRCECGTEKVARGTRLTDGTIKSCGCLAAERRIDTKGLLDVEWGSATHRAWVNMKSRCTDTGRDDYHRYGGRGIVFDPAWEQYDNFLRDMGKRPDGLSLDRRDNSSGYCKENCRWATSTEQANNRSSNRPVTYAGRTQTPAQWCHELRLNYDTVRQRLVSGWPVERTLTTATGRP